MKVTTKIKIKDFKKKISKKWYCILEFIFKPLARIYSRIEDRKHKKKCDPSTYNQLKIKKELYKELQRRLLRDNSIYIFDLVFISEEDSSSDFLLIEDLFWRGNSKYLKNYYYYAKPKTLKMSDVWDVIKGFNNNDISVVELDKEGFKQCFPDWKYIEYSQLYRKSERILKVSISK